MSGSTDAIVEMLSTHGLWLLAPLSIIEGPIVTVIAGWLASLAILNPVAVFIIIVLGDVIGDAILYAAGRGLRLDRLPLVGRFFRIPRAKLVPLVKSFREKGIRILIFGKVTQAAGFLILIAAGAARMNFGLFLLVNFLAAIPKAILLMALGYLIGAAHAQIAGWLSWGGAGMLILLILGAGLWLWFARRPRGEEAE